MVKELGESKMSGYQIRKDAEFRQRKDTTADIDWRKRHNAALAQAVQDRKERYPVLTTENAEDAINYQEQRIKELMGIADLR